ncbi:MAG: sigma-54-dependent Fis family transcriptional regulator [Bdellovibrionales bacterium CG10_big_fil_rev_8_21_14_0_10_45_34]|nr:MAG: sigma-54-dependent Fis family transcriptional regulator [Bdellovibrionales bacterium CG10_big_fil_rev_8_21_14_0_10_45_34]
MNKIQVLIVDDEPELRESIKLALEREDFGLPVVTAEADNGAKALQMFSQTKWDLILLDVRMPEMDGLTTLKKIKEIDPSTFVVLITAHGNVQDAIDAIKEGAYDYVEKPIQAEKLSEIVRKALDAREMVSKIAMSNPIFDDDIESDMVGGSTQMRQIFDLVSRLTKVETTVLIRGENGTGKELVARAIHFNSPRKAGPFVAINCGAIPVNLMESELFGHERGAFTGATERKIGKFQLANQGTLFLDEIGELPPEMQVKLLRVLQDKTFMPVGSNREVRTGSRVIAATNRNLERMIVDGSFREDLFYRLNVMPIFIPPLRERLDDIESLVSRFIEKFNLQHKRKMTGVSDESLKAIKHYGWPGNIRELENVIEHAFIVENSSTISLASLPQQIQAAAKTTAPAPGVHVESALDFEEFKEKAEREFILAALKANNGRINQTVAQANIPKNTLLRKMRKYGIIAKEFFVNE